MPSKRFKKLPEKTNLLKPLKINELLPLVKKNCTTKFDESIDLSITINNKQKKNEINIRTAINLPGGTGKKVKVAVVAEEAKHKDAKDAGADIVGGDDFIEKIKNGDLNFEKLISSTSMMLKLSKLGKILGPKGLMPNPKLGTVTNEIGIAFKVANTGQVKFKNENTGIFHAGIGKLSFKDEDILLNLRTFYSSILKNKPDAVKGSFVKKVTIASTMGIGLKINQVSLR